jgi:hypothetical protein
MRNAPRSLRQRAMRDSQNDIGRESAGEVQNRAKSIR